MQTEYRNTKKKFEVTVPPEVELLRFEAGRDTI